MTRHLTLILLFVVSFTLATFVGLRQDRQHETSRRSGSVLQLMFGDGRKMFANHIYAKADAYFHRGNYPSIFDLNARPKEMHMESAGHDSEHDQDAHGHANDEREPPQPTVRPAEPADWVARFGRRFHPAGHAHLDKGEERELLPWLKLSAELDPQNVQTYLVGAYWLRARLKKPDEAEEFLRDGLRANPNHPEILLELGRLYSQNRSDPARARNIWDLALTRWRETEGIKTEPDMFVFVQIVGNLARVEEQSGRFQQAIEYLELLKQTAPQSEPIQKQIDELRLRLQPAARP